MRVQYAAQTLSSSTADSLEYLKHFNFPGLENVEATVEYCRAIYRIFDFLNSKSKFSKPFKSKIYYNTIEFKINAQLISHLNIFHDVKPVSEFKCLEPGYYRVLSNFHFFKNHINQHKDVLVVNNKPYHFPVSISK